MKKLKVVLTLLLALCCSLCMFACGGGEKNISEVELSGQKLNFKEGEDFSVGDLKVTVYYQGDDEPHELKADEYEVDSSAYNKAQAGQYLIYVIPKNQPASLTEGGKDNRMKRSYYASVDHSWTETTGGKYQYECACGAKRNNYTGLEDKISTVAWGNPATLTKGGEGKTYGDGVKAPIAGENHVSFGSLVAGQSLTLTLQITGLTRNATPGAASAWDSPLMGIRNGADGVLPREDGWIIGQAAGYQVPAECNIPVGGGAATTGIATKDSPLWQVMTDGTSWSAGTAFPNDASNPTKWSTVVVEYIYQTDGVMLMRHTLKKYDDTETVYTISVNLPRAAYEVCAYGEFCDYTVTAVEFVAGLAIEKYEVTAQPTNLVQPAGKLFDTTGLKTKATFSDGSTLDDNFNAYAYRDITPEATEANPNPEAVKTRVTLSNTPLTADMYGFFVEFNGMEAELSKDIKVIATPITGANATEIKVGEVSFEAPEVGYDYAVTADKTYIRLTTTGTAAKATAAQAAALGGSTHFVAFKLLTNLKAEEVAETIEATANNVVVKATKVNNTVDVVLGLKADFAKTFDLNLNTTTKVQIDLSGLAALPAAGAEITATDFTIDAGGTYTVTYTGLTGTVADLTLATGNASDTVAKVKEAIKETYSGTTVPTRDKFYRASNTLYIVKVDDGTAGQLTVTYWLAAPELVNLTSERMTTAVSLRNGDTVLASANLIYNLEASSSAINIGTDGAPVYVTVSGNKLLVYAFTETTNIADGINFAATLNVEHPYTAGQVYKMDYNVGVGISGGEAAWLDENDLTFGESVPKLVTVGTVNDTTDYDKGVILIASLNLPEIDVRKDDNTAVFHFTANENTVDGDASYTIYTVTGDAITKATVTAAESGERTQVVARGCLVDGVQAFQTEGGFYYGAIITAATGAHKWGEAVSGVKTCENCGALNWQETSGEDSYEITVLPAQTNVVNPDTSDTDWWANPTADTPVKGNFLLHYTWKNTDANYGGNGALEMHDADGNYFGYRLFANDYNPGSDPNNSTSKLHADDKVITTVFKKNGTAVESLDVTNWAGDFDLLVYRYDTTLVIKVTDKVGEDTYELNTTITKFTTDDLAIHINGNHYFCENIKMSIGSVVKVFNDSKEIEFGHALDPGQEPEEGKHYTFNDWYELPNIKDGMTITAFGSQKGDMANNWSTLLWEAKQGWTGRLDNYGWSFGDVLFGTAATKQSNSISPAVEQPDPDGAKFWAKYCEIASDCEWTIKFKLSGKVLTVDIVLTGEDAVYTQNYTLTANSIPEDGLGLHLTAEACTITFRGYTVE